MNKIRAIILDDEPAGIDILKYEIESHFPEISLLKTFSDVESSYDFLKTNKIDLLFLDISIPECNGFDFLGRFDKIDFEVIFVTAHEEYALRAFDFYAVDYLLKPVETEKLRRAVDRLMAKNKSDQNFEKFENLFKNFSLSNNKNNTLAIPTLDGFEIIELNELIYLKADGNYTELYMKNKKILVSKTLGDFEKVLPAEFFLRIHNSFVINIYEIRKYIKGDGGIVMISSGEQLPVSRINKPKLLAKIRPQL